MMLAMLRPVICPLLLALLYLEVGTAQNRWDSVCQTRQYRALSTSQQNQHHCMILEKLQTELHEDRDGIKTQFETLHNMMTKFQHSVNRNMQALVITGKDSAKSIPTLRDIPLVRDCQELSQNGVKLSGVYPIRMPDRKIVNVWCDMETAYGGWTIIQRRLDGSINFTRDWDNYAHGFGNVNSEYWLGNRNLHLMTNNKNFSIRFDIWDWDDNHAYAFYDFFQVESEKKDFKLHIEGYSGTAGDAMSHYHNNQKFSTVDTDNDEWYLSCAQKDQSGWWFRACGLASLNGLYVKDGMANIAPDGIIKGIIWYNWKNDYGYSMKRTEIKMKPHSAVKDDEDLARVTKEQEEARKVQEEARKVQEEARELSNTDESTTDSSSNNQGNEMTDDYDYDEHDDTN